MSISGTLHQLLWWQRGVVYQIYPRSFLDTNADGIGDLQGIIEKLDYLNGAAGSLGVDAIWISPFYPSPMADFGYDISDYCNVHPLFGDLATFDRLVREAHRREIRVIIDYVPNHTSDQHPWFLESRSSRINPKRDWYIWRDPRPDGSLPNNWGSAFGGPAWTWDPITQEYYLHQFLPEQPDLNWRNPEVRQAMLDVLRFWLDRGVDGFRMDVVGMVMKEKDLRDNPQNPSAPTDLHPNNLMGRLDNIYNQDQPEVHEVIHDFRRLLDQYGERVGIGEIWYELPSWIRYYGVEGQGLHLPFNFRLMDLPWSPDAIRQSVDQLEAALPVFAWPNYVLGNHDRQRLASRVGLSQARVAAMLLLTLRGTPTLYNGDELGLENGKITAEMVQDPQGKNLGLAAARDFGRTPMQWDSSPYAGFSNVQPWLPVSEDFPARNAAIEAADPFSMLNLYRQLLALRRQHAALHSGSYRPVETGEDSSYVYLREGDGRRFLVALNFTHQEISLALPIHGQGKLILSTLLDRQETVSLQALHLRADEGVLIELGG